MADSATRIKICGLTNAADARLAADLGAWAVGMIFYDPSPRACSLADAEQIAAELRRRTELCGVFVNATLATIAATSERLGLTLVQLHGDEGPSFCREVARRTGAKVTKAIPLRDAGSLRDIERFHTHYHLIDSHRAGMRGGTGTTFDWSLLRARRSAVPLILSGGLSAENVAHAVDVVRPFAVDVASGVEAAPGAKHPRKLEAFFAAARAADAARAPQGPGLAATAPEHAA